MGIVLGGLLWAARAPTEWWRDLPRSSLYLPLSLLSALYVFSLAGTENVSGAVEEIGRLLFHISFFVLIAIYVRDRQTLRWTLMALVASGLVLALIGIYQQVTDTYLWNEALALRGVRRNATFVDPNIYARFLVVTMVMAMALFFGDKSRFRYVLLATFGLAALALPFTSSRSNWLAAAVLLPAVAAALPMNAWRKTKLIALGGAVGVALALVVAHLEPAVADRFQSLGDGTDSLGVRRDLVRAGWQMFLDNPVFGVGLDAFEANLRGPYRHLLPPDASTFLSHASLITIMAELGAAGLAVLALLFYRFGRICWRIYSAETAVDKATVVGLAGACLAIFLSSQAEGRFFEEPYLWLILGLAVALAGIRDREAEAAPISREGD
jgi:O-antigen ligase